ncbi:MAG: short chain dehydrogenase family protein [Devosia sp.]|nr:short chain dehydrogenase family protein [Devosia sp.]
MWPGTSGHKVTQTMTQMSFDGQVVLVTGAGRGIAREVALQFAALGARVAVCDLSAERAADTAAAVERAGGTTLCFGADVGNEAAVMDMVGAIASQWGPVENLINAAGSYGAAFRPTHETPVEEWDAVFGSNVRGSFICAKAVLPGMMEARRGRIVNFSSNAGRSVSPLLGCSYTAAKTAIIGLTRHLSREYAGYGIRVNTIAPGPVNAERVADLIGGEQAVRDLAAQIPLGRLAEPADIVEGVLFLCADASRFVTGTILDVSGGYVLA